MDVREEDNIRQKIISARQQSIVNLEKGVNKALEGIYEITSNNITDINSIYIADPKELKETIKTLLYIRESITKLKKLEEIK